MTALINDTTGTLIASHYVNSRTKIAVIFGTGCNAAYMEDVKNIEKIKDLGIDPEAQMAINCEWVGSTFITMGLQEGANETDPRVLLTLIYTNIFRGPNMIRLSTKHRTNLGSKHLK